MRRENYKIARYRTPWGPILNSAKTRSLHRNKPFNLTDDWAIDRWTGKCELTGIPFVLGSNTRTLYSPSLDQIKPGAGYTTDNCRFILWCINAMKDTGTDEDVYRVAQAIVDSRPS